MGRLGLDTHAALDGRSPASSSCSCSNNTTCPHPAKTIERLRNAFSHRHASECKLRPGTPPRGRSTACPHCFGVHVYPASSPLPSPAGHREGRSGEEGGRQILGSRLLHAWQTRAPTMSFFYLSSQHFSEPHAANSRGLCSHTSPVTPSASDDDKQCQEESQLGPRAGSGISCVALGKSFYFHATRFPIFKVTSLNTAPCELPDTRSGGATVRSVSEQASQGQGRW